MWTRFHIECQNCEKSLILGANSEENRCQLILIVPNCSSALKSILTVDFKNMSRGDFKVLKGEFVKWSF
jgi:hypothetical protein